MCDLAWESAARSDAMAASAAWMFVPCALDAGASLPLWGRSFGWASFYFIMRIPGFFVRESSWLKMTGY